MKKIWLRRILRGLSLTSAMFIFQACYGTGDDYQNDVFIRGQVVSTATGMPIQGIKIAVDSMNTWTITDSAGNFAFWTLRDMNMNIAFTDEDSTLNGHFQNIDTLLTKANGDVELNIAMEPK